MPAVNQTTMRRSLLLALALAGLAPSNAVAAPFGELPFRQLAQSATCLRATGAPGELVRRTDSAIELTRVGQARALVLSAAHSVGCPRAASRPNGAAVIAF